MLLPSLGWRSSLRCKFPWIVKSWSWSLQEDWCLLYFLPMATTGAAAAASYLILLRAKKIPDQWSGVCECVCVESLKRLKTFTCSLMIAPCMVKTRAPWPILFPRPFPFDAVTTVRLCNALQIFETNNIGETEISFLSSWWDSQPKKQGGQALLTWPNEAG